MHDYSALPTAREESSAFRYAFGYTEDPYAQSEFNWTSKSRILLARMVRRIPMTTKILLFLALLFD
jgi:hypothetical protein